MAKTKATDKEQSKEKEKITPVKYPDIPINIKQIDSDYIIDYATDKGESVKKWVKEKYAEKVPNDKNGKERSMSFIELRNAFVDEYMKELKPKPKPKKASLQSRIDAL